MAFRDRLKHAWNAFRNNDDYEQELYKQEMQNAKLAGRPVGYTGYSTRPDRPRLRMGTERSIIASIYNRIAIDVAAISIQHVRTDENGRYSSTIKSDLNNCFSIQANIDQTGNQFFMDLVLSLFDEGTVAVVPVDTSVDLLHNGSYDIQSIRVGKILQWMPRHVQVEVYNDWTGNKENLTLPKDKIAIIENPLYAVMNEPSSTLARLKQKLALLDVTDNKASSDKLNMLIQVPYTIKSATGQKRAAARLSQITDQLDKSEYGIAYIDATEKVTQINRPIDNTLANQIDYLTKQLYAQLGLNEDVFSGKADESTMLNYYQRTIKPILEAITSEFRRKFLTKTARTQGQSIMYFRNPFSLVPIQQLADSSSKFVQSQVLVPNEIRSALGYPPSQEAQAEQLANPNINTLNDMNQQSGNDDTGTDENQNGTDSDLSEADIDNAESQLDELEKLLNGDDNQSDAEKQLKQLMSEAGA